MYGVAQFQYIYMENQYNYNVNLYSQFTNICVVNENVYSNLYIPLINMFLFYYLFFDPMYFGWVFKLF